MDGKLFIMEGSVLSRFLIFQWNVAVSLWKVVYCRDFFTPIDDSLVIMEGSLLSRIYKFQWMVAISFWKVVRCRDICYSNGL